MNNAVGYARPAARPNPVVLGTDGIGADMLEEFRLAYARRREDDVLASPDTAWRWLEGGWALVPEARGDTVTWNYDHADAPWHVAFTPGVRALDVVTGDGEVLLRDGRPTRVDAAEVRAKAAEQPPAAAPLSPPPPRGQSMTTAADADRDACPRSTCRTPTRSGRAWRYAQYAEAKGFDAVWQAESRLVREATVPMAAFAA